MLKTYIALLHGPGTPGVGAKVIQAKDEDEALDLLREDAERWDYLDLYESVTSHPVVAAEGQRVPTWVVTSRSTDQIERD